MSDIRKLFAKIYPKKSLEWELRRTNVNLRLEYRLYIKRNDFESLEEVENLRTEFQTEIAKSKIRGQILIVSKNKEKARNQENTKNYPNKQNQNVKTLTQNENNTGKSGQNRV